MPFAALADALAARLPRDAPYVLVGESFGGPLAVTLAARGLPRLAGLVLCATFLRHPRALVRALAPLARFAPIHAVPARLAAVMLLGAWATPPRRAALAAALAGVPPAVFRRRLADILPIDVSGLLARVDAPLLVLRAAHDRLVSASAGDAIRRARPDAQVVNVDGPHCLLEAAPRGCADAVRAFLAALA